MKRYFLLLPIALFLLILTQTPAMAVATSAPASASPLTTSRAVTDAQVNTASQKAATSWTAYKAAKAADKVVKAKAVGVDIVDARIALLNNMLGVDYAAVSSTDATALKNSLQAEINKLDTIKTSVNGATTLEALKTQVKSVYDARVFAIVVPQIQATKAVDQAVATLKTLQDLNVKINSKITAMTAAGSSTTSITSAYTDYKAKLTDASNLIDKSKTALATIRPSDVTGGQAMLKTVRSNLTTIRADFVAARADLKLIKAALSTAASSSPSASPSSSASAGATPVPTTRATALPN